MVGRRGGPRIESMGACIMGACAGSGGGHGMCRVWCVVPWRAWAGATGRLARVDCDACASQGKGIDSAWGRPQEGGRRRRNPTRTHQQDDEAGTWTNDSTHSCPAPLLYPAHHRPSKEQGARGGRTLREGRMADERYVCAVLWVDKGGTGTIEGSTRRACLPAGPTLINIDQPKPPRLPIPPQRQDRCGRARAGRGGPRSARRRG